MAAGGAVKVVLRHVLLVVESVHGEKVHCLSPVMLRHFQHRLFEGRAEVVADDADNLAGRVALPDLAKQFYVGLAEGAVGQGIDLSPRFGGISDGVNRVQDGV